MDQIDLKDTPRHEKRAGIGYMYSRLHVAKNGRQELDGRHTGSKFGNED